MKLPALLRSPLSFDQDALKRTALYSLLLFFSAHAFCFFNLTYSTGSVMLHAASGRNAQIAAGQYLLPVYWRIRGGVSSPLWVGMLSALYLTLTNLILAWLMRLSRPSALFALCGATTANAAVLSLCAGSLHTADASFLALLLAALACVCCLHVRFGVIPSVLLLTAALALDSNACAFFAAAMLICMLSDLLSAKDSKRFTANAGALVITLAAAVALYALGFALMLRRNSLESSVSFQLLGGNPLAAYLSPIRALLSPLTAYAHLSIIIHVLLALCCALCIVKCMRTHGMTVTLLLTAGTLLLPLCCGFTLLSSQTDIQITPAHCLLDVFAVMLLSHLMPDRKALRRLLAAAFAVLFTGCIVFSNQVYLKKNLEYESTLSLMSRVIAHMEDTPGYEPGYTPVVFIGTPEDSAFSIERKGFEHLSALDAAKSNHAIATSDDMIWYMWDVMGYPINFVSTFDLENLCQTEAVAAMPAFPQEGCCTFVEDTLVVKLSSF